MLNRKDIPFYIVLILLFILFKLANVFASNQDIIFLTGPTSKMVDLATGTRSQFIADQGYLNLTLGFIIDKSCAGFNFWIICFLSLSFSALNYFRKNRDKILSIIILSIASYFITLFVNASRIMFSVLIGKLKIFEGLNQFKWLHEAEGIFVYLFFLISIHLIFNHLLNKIIEKNAQPA